MQVRSVASLSPEQAAILWCVRLWVDGLAGPQEAERRLHARLATLGVEAVAPFLGGFMAAVREGAFRAVAAGCVGHPGVEEDEQALLDVIALCQEARIFEVLLRLRGLLRAEAIPVALACAEKTACALTRAGWFLPAPESGMSQFGFPDESRGAAPRQDGRSPGEWGLGVIVARVFPGRHEAGRPGRGARCE